MFELFVVGTFWFWALIVAEIVLLFVFVEYENGFGATVSLLVALAALQWMGNVDIIAYMVDHPMKIGAAVVAYFLLGAVWGVVKWWIYCKDLFDEYNECKLEWLAEKGVSDTKVVPDHLKGEFKEFLSRKNNSRYSDPKLGSPPKVSENKAMILRSMTFWWISMLWSFLEDFVKRGFRIIYQKLVHFMQSISDKMFSSVDEDLK